MERPPDGVLDRERGAEAASALAWGGWRGESRLLRERAACWAGRRTATAQMMAAVSSVIDHPRSAFAHDRHRPRKGMGVTYVCASRRSPLSRSLSDDRFTVTATFSRSPTCTLPFSGPANSGVSPQGGLPQHLPRGKARPRRSCAVSPTQCAEPTLIGTAPAAARGRSAAGRRRAGRWPAAARAARRPPSARAHRRQRRVSCGARSSGCRAARLSADASRGRSAPPSATGGRAGRRPTSGPGRTNRRDCAVPTLTRNGTGPSTARE